jgi:hypothetical protein
MRLALPWLVLLLAAGGVGRANAVECAPITGAAPGLERIDARVRLGFLRERLRVAARHTRIWTWTWAGLYSSLTVGELALLAGADRHAQIDNGIGAGASFVGVLSIALSPQTVIADQYWLERRLRRAPPATDVCALVADAERLLVRDAKSSAFGKSALVHAGNFAFNIGVGLLLGIGFHHWDQAALQGLTGIAVGEVMILSQPNDTVDDLRRYRAGNLGLPPSFHKVSWAVAPTAARDRAGLVLGIGF